jgi:tetratricopeptide (TPR) repeat protein
MSRILLQAMAAAVAAATCLSAPVARANGPDVSALLARGLSLGYNLDHAAAAAAFRDAAATAPSSVAAHRLTAAAAWIAILFEQGAITIEDYLGQARSDTARPAPNRGLAATFRRHIDRARTLAEQQVRERPQDADAHYQAGAVHGLIASYTATVEGRLTSSLGPARRAYREQERALELDPDRRDAGLIAGTYRYTVASLSFPKRLMARLAGFGSGRERGIALVEGAARYDSDTRPSARFMLVLLYNRERRYDDALRQIAELRRTYPRNRLLWLETGSTLLRAGRPAGAVVALEHGLVAFRQDTRPRAGGEESRWRLAYGTALAATGRVAEADRELNAAIAAASRAWVRGRAQLQIGQLRARAGDRAAARTAFTAAERLCTDDDDEECADEARAAIRRARG